MNKVVCLCVCLFVVNSAAFAARIQIDISGTLYSRDAAGKPINTDMIKDGDAFSYRVVFNESTTPDRVFDVAGSAYFDEIVSFSGSAGRFTFAGTSGTAVIRNDFYGGIFSTVHNGDPSVDLFGITRNDFTQTSGLVAGSPISYLELSLHTGIALDNDWLTQDKLPRSLLADEDYGIVYFKFAQPGINQSAFYTTGRVDDYTVTNLTTPIPGAVWLFGSGLVGLLGFKRAKTTRSLVYQG